MPKRVNSAKDRDDRKRAQYEALMAAKRGVVIDDAPLNFDPVEERPIADEILAWFPGAEVVGPGRAPLTAFDNGAKYDTLDLPPSKPLSDHKHFRDQGFCQVCKATSCGSGWAPNWNAKPLWFCSVCGPKAAKRFYSMRGQKLNEYETAAALEGGTKAGQYLDEVGVTDLLQLTPEEYATFCQRLLAGYVTHMRSITADIIPPE